MSHPFPLLIVLGVNSFAAKHGDSRFYLKYNKVYNSSILYFP